MRYIGVNLIHKKSWNCFFRILYFVLFCINSQKEKDNFLSTYHNYVCLVAQIQLSGYSNGGKNESQTKEWNIKTTSLSSSRTLHCYYFIQPRFIHKYLLRISNGPIMYSIEFKLSFHRSFFSRPFFAVRLRSSIV